jgi:hypothetical protein
MQYFKVNVLSNSIRPTLSSWQTDMFLASKLMPLTIAPMTTA